MDWDRAILVRQEELAKEFRPWPRLVPETPRPASRTVTVWAVPPMPPLTPSPDTLTTIGSWPAVTLAGTPLIDSPASSTVTVSAVPPMPPLIARPAAPGDGPAVVPAGAPLIDSPAAGEVMEDVSAAGESPRSPDLPQAEVMTGNGGAARPR